jgi:hypothetical protein
MSSCGKKMEPVKVGTLKEYKDPTYGFKIKYPSEWKQLGQSPKAKFYQSQAVADKFLEPGKPGELGTEVIVWVAKIIDISLDSLLYETREEIKNQNGKILSEAPTSLKEKQGLKIEYSIPITNKMSLDGYKVIVQSDTLIYTLGIAGFGEMYPAHKAVFDAIYNSFEFPVPVIKTAEGWNASTTLEKYDTPFFTMQYPDNMEFTNPAKGKNDLSVGLRADRLDCSIQFDVFGAQALTVEKVFEQNKSRYKNVKSNADINIDGQNAQFINYSPVKDIESRSYFIVKNDKVIRITLNWFQPKKANYFPAFEQIVNTLKIK